MPNLTPEQQAEQNKLYDRYIELLQKVNSISAQNAKLKADAAKAAGDLVKEVERLEDIETELVNKASYLFDTFRETTAELKNQNLILDAGKSAFKSLTSIAEDFNYQQRGISDLSERDLKRNEQKIAQSKVELVTLTKKLSLDGVNYNRQTKLNDLLDLSNQDGVKLTKNQKLLLDQLTKEKELLDSANNALKEGIPLLNEELKISKQIYKTRTELNGVAGAAASILEKFGGNLASFLDITEAKEEVDKFNKKLIDDALKSESVLKKMKQLDEDRIRVLDSSVSIQREIADIQIEINAAIAAGSKQRELENEKLRIQEGLQNNLIKISKLESSLHDQRIQQLNLQLALNNLATDDVMNRLSLQQQITDIDNDRARSLQELNQLADQNITYETRQLQIGQEISDQAREAGKLSDLELKRQQKKQDLLDNEKQIEQDLLAIDKKEADIKKAAIASVNTLGNKFEALGVFISNSAGGIKKLFTDPITLMTTLVGLGFKANKQVVELGKSFGISAKAAENIRQEVAQFSRETGDTFVNTDRLLKAQAELSQEMGMAVKYSNEELVTFAKLTELTGLTAQEAGKLAQASAATGMSTEAYTDKIREGAFSAMLATKTHFSMKEVMQDISKLSAGTLIKFQGNPKALAATVVEAKKLGLSLDQINKTGDSLLNFESSIESELKAELMTGKQLNLERARAAALSNDQAALTKEIGEQVGTLNDYQNMNVLAQQSLAEAFGMSRDEMSEMLMKQEAINQYGDEAGKLNKEQLEEMKRKGLSASEYIQQQEQQIAAQDKFNNAMTKLQDIIGNLVAGPVGQLLDTLANMVGVAMKLLSFLSPIFNVIASAAEAISDFASTPFGGIIAGLTGIYLLSGKISSSFGGIGKSIKDTFSGGGIKGFKDKIKGMLPGGKSKGKELTEKVTSTGPESVTENVESASGKADKVGKGGGGKSFKAKMKDIAAGLKEFADAKVLLGALNLIPASLGLTAMIPGAIGAKILDTINGKKVKETLKGIAAGLVEFGKNNILLGSLNLLVASAGLTAMIPGAIGAKILSSIDGKKLKESLKAISSGIESFGKASLVLGAVNMLIAAVGLTAMIPGAIGAKIITQVDGKKFQKSMEGIAAGIASFGKGSVLLGAGAMIIAAVGLTAMIPGAMGAKLISQVDSKKFQKSMEGIAAGIESFGKGKVALGALNMVIASVGLVAMIPGAIGAKLISQIDSKKFQKAMEGISTGIESFGKGKVALGALNMVLASIGLTAMIPGAIGAKIILQINGDKLKKVLNNIAEGISSFGKGNILLGTINLGLAAIGLTTMIPGVIAAKIIEQINGKKLKESLKAIADGISEMGTGKTAIGALILPLISVGLVSMIPGVLGAKAIEQINGKKLKTNLTNLAEGIGSLGTGKTAIGALILPLISASLVLMIPGVLGAKAIEQIDGKKLKDSLTSLAEGIGALGTGKTAIGALLLPLISIGLVAIIPGVLGAKLIEQIDGKKLKNNLNSLAEGISLLGTGKTAIGALALIPISLGLITMIPGVMGAKLIEQIDGKKLKNSLSSLAEGISSMGTGTVLLGSLALITASIGLVAMIPGIVGAKLIELIDGKKFQKSMEGLSKGIGAFGENASAGALVKLLFGGIALAAFSVAVPALLLLQFVNGSLIEKTLGGIGRGIAAFSQNVSYGDLIKGAVAIALLGASLIPFTYAVSLMGDIDPATILIGVGALGALAGIAYLVSKASSNMIVGSLAIAILGAALIPFTYALSLLANVKMENVLAAAAGLVIFGAAVFGLGALMMTGVGAFIFGAGILAMIALGGAMMILGQGLKVVSEGGSGIATLFQQLSELDATKLDAVAPALKTIGEAIMYLGAGGVLSALGNLLGGSSPVDMIKDIAASSDQLQVASTSFKSFAESMEKFTNIDPSKLEALAPALNLLSDSMISLGIGSLLMNIGGDPSKMLQNISDSGIGIEKAASGIQLMTNSITQLATSLNSLDISKLEKIAEMSNSGGITGFLSNVFSKITSIMGGSEASSPTAGPIESVTSPGITTTPISTPSSTTNTSTSSTSSNITSTSIQPGIDLTPMIAAINEVKASIDKLYNKNTSINMDGTKVGTTLTQGSYKVA